MSEFKIFPTRVFEQFRENTMAKLSSDGSIDLSLFDKTKIARWKEKKKKPLNQVYTYCWPNPNGNRYSWPFRPNNNQKKKKI